MSEFLPEQNLFQKKSLIPSIGFLHTSPELSKAQYKAQRSGQSVVNSSGLGLGISSSCSTLQVVQPKVPYRNLNGKTVVPATKASTITRLSAIFFVGWLAQPNHPGLSTSFQTLNRGTTSGIEKVKPSERQSWRNRKMYNIYIYICMENICGKKNIYICIMWSLYYIQ